MEKNRTIGEDEQLHIRTLRFCERVFGGVSSLDASARGKLMKWVTNFPKTTTVESLLAQVGQIVEYARLYNIFCEQLHKDDFDLTGKELSEFTRIAKTDVLLTEFIGEHFSFEN